MFHPFLSLKNWLVALVLTASAFAAPFVAPTEANPPFRRDLLPIDADSMVTLSQDLNVLARSISLETPAGRRSVAQALALSLALDPANASARDNLVSVTSGKPLSEPKPGQLTRSKSRVWQIRAWLSTPEAGIDGKLLADLMGDAVSVIDSRHPVAVTLRESPEAGKWDGWVAPLSEFKDGTVAKNETDPFADVPADMPKDGKSRIVLTKAKLTTVLYDYNEAADSWSLKPTIVSLDATPENEGTFQVTIPGSLEELDDIDSFITPHIVDALKAYHGMLPKNGRVAIHTGESDTYSFTKNQFAITGPGFILANAAITGQEPEATVLVSLDEENRLILPAYFWNLLSELRKGKGGRLVVPRGAEEYFTALLTLEDPEFFLNYEVLVASSPAEFMDLCAKTPSEKHLATFAKFAEIKAKAAGNPTGTYLANRYVRQRLEEISAEAPYHLSSKLLAIQGAGERPRVLTRKVLAAEIWHAVDPIQKLTMGDLQAADSSLIASMDMLYETTRAGVDNLDRYTDLHDRDILEQGRTLTTTVRTLSRTLRSRNDDLQERFKAIQIAHSAMAEANTALRKTLSELTGEALPEDSDKPGQMRKRFRRRNQN